jgi:SAM-dependent MidA family methyltransferase
MLLLKRGRQSSTSSLQTQLIQLMREKIRADGPQPFAWFMRQALYHPEHGYYSSGRARIGRGGDYFTNVSVGPLFGRLLAAQFAQMWERLDKIDNFIIVEEGAHDGQFARDVLDAAHKDAPDFFSALRYRIIEPFRVWQDRQRQTLADFESKVEWPNELTPFTGVHFSNELLDAMPINLRNKLVDLTGDEFVLADSPREQVTNQSQLDWIDKVAANLQRGFVLIVDYGFIENDFREVVQARAQHRHLNSVFEQIGEADITAHINWSDIATRAEAKGLRVAGFTDQHHFLTGLIAATTSSSSSLDLTALSRQVREGGLETKKMRELQTLLHPEMLGRAFQVLLLNKDVDLIHPPHGGTDSPWRARPLSGFQFARDARTLLNE